MVYSSNNISMVIEIFLLKTENNSKIIQLFLNEIQIKKHKMSSTTPRRTPSNYSDYTWVNGFKDFFTFLKENFLFSITFFIYHSCIFYILIASYNRRMSPLQKEICPKLNHTNYYNGHEFLPIPDGDLQTIYNKVINHVRTHKSTFVEDLVALASPATTEQAEAAVQMNGEFFIHPYYTVAPCKPVEPNNNLMIGAFVYLGVFTLFLVYITSPYSKKY